MQRDVVLRWLQQISAIIAKLLRGDPTITVQFARDQLQDAKQMLLGSLEPLLLHLDPPRVADFLVDPYRTYGYAQLLALESALERAEGRPERATALTGRALALAREAVRRADPVPSEWEAWIAAAEGEVEAGSE